MSSEKVSVVIPTWNHAAYLTHAIQSVLQQTYEVHEILVCDDGSTDGSREMVAAFGDKRIKWILGERAGRPAVPRNRGLRQATGTWVAFLDSDDAWLPEKLASQFKAMHRTRCLASSTNAWRLLPKVGRSSPYLEYNQETIGLNDLLQVNQVICSSSLVRRDLVLRAGGFPEAEKLRAIEDFALWLRIATMTSFAYVDVPQVDYLDHPAESWRALAETKELQQQEDVRLNFLEWSNQSDVSASSRKLIKQFARQAMKANGRGFFERMKVLDWQG
ncbi:MAG: hypothetical protein RLZZ447_1083 [Verrucomicrobiota bacterium]|jgi:glycosyltransferase involved in cell wall biosynthesis